MVQEDAKITIRFLMIVAHYLFTTVQSLGLYQNEAGWLLTEPFSGLICHKSRTSQRNLSKCQLRKHFCLLYFNTHLMLTKGKLTR